MGVAAQFEVQVPLFRVFRSDLRHVVAYQQEGVFREVTGIEPDPDIEVIAVEECLLEACFVVFQRVEFLLGGHDFRAARVDVLYVIERHVVIVSFHFVIQQVEIYDDALVFLGLIAAYAAFVARVHRLAIVENDIEIVIFERLYRSESRKPGVVPVRIVAGGENGRSHGHEKK